MKKTLSTLLAITLTAMLSSCASMPDLIMWNDDEPDYASASESARAPLDVPPSLRGNIKVPKPEKIATVSGMNSGAHPEPHSGAHSGVMSSAGSVAAKESVAGKAVSLDARVYEQGAAHTFSSVIDAMTALNMPVHSVDSASGTVTTDWIRSDSKTKNSGLGGFSGLFGGGNAIQALRWRFVVRVLRQQIDESEKTRLQIHTIGQAFMNKHWVDQDIKRKVSEELFSAVEERL